MTASPRTLLGRLCVALIAGSFLSVALLGAEPAPKQFDVPSDTAERSLKKFSEQASLDVLIGTKVGREVRTNAIKGEMQPRQALDAMLRDTGLVVFQDSKTGAMTVRRETPVESKNVNRAIAESSARPEGSKNERDYYMNASGEQVLKLPEYMVKGSKTLDADIRRTRDDALPFVVFSRGEIESSNATNIEEFLRTRLPMNSGLAPNGSPQASIESTNQASPASGIGNSNINLRGLGSAQTLILIDGRRAPRAASAFSADFSQADINGIPLSMIDRIEILPSSAGGIYGGGATGGVLNIIRKRNYHGINAKLFYSGTTDGGAETRKADLSAGITLNDGRTAITTSFAGSETGALYAADRPDIWRRGRELFAETNTTSSIPVSAYTSNIRTAVAGTLILDSGLSLGANRTYVPVNYAGIASDGGAGFVMNAGKQSSDLSNDLLGSYSQLRGASSTRSGMLTMQHEFSKRLDFFVDFAAAENIGEIKYPSGGSLISLGATVPGNPFGQAITVAIPLVGVPATVQSMRTATLGGSVGTHVRLPGEWIMTGEVSLNRVATKIRYGGDMLNIAAVTAAAASGAIDLFRDLNRYPIDYRPYYITSPVFGKSDTSNDARVASLRAAGPIARIADESIMLTFLAEDRQDKVPEFVTRSVSGAISFLTYYPERVQSVSSAYAEVALPLLRKSENRTKLGKMDFTGTFRYDQYRTRTALPQSVANESDRPIVQYRTSKQGAANSTLAIFWTPAQALRVRLSHATGFLPPAVGQLVPVSTLNTTPIASLADPHRAGRLLGSDGPITTVSTGNPNLKVEDSRTISAGIIFMPPILSGFRLSIDFSEIRKNNEIVNPPSASYILNNEDEFPGRVQRGSKLATDPADWRGPITVYDFSPLNATKTSVQAWDLRVDYVRTFGEVKATIYGAATYQPDLKRQLVIANPMLNAAGYFDGPLRWRGNMGADINVKNWTVGWNVQCYDRYSLHSFNSINAASVNQSLTRIRHNGGATKVPAQMYHDVFMRHKYSIRQGNVLSGTAIVIGIQNLLGKVPPTVVQAVGNGPGSTYSGYGDPRLRRVSLSFEKQF